MAVDLPQPSYKILKWGCLLLLFWGAEGKGQEPAREKEQTLPAAQERIEGQTTDGKGKDEEAQQRREAEKRAVTVGVLLLILVIVAGLSLVVLVLFWGYRTRRIVRAPLPSQSKQDELWYLRPSRQKIADDREQPQTDDPPPDLGETESP